MIDEHEFGKLIYDLSRLYKNKDENYSEKLAETFIKVSINKLTTDGTTRTFLDILKNEMRESFSKPLFMKAFLGEIRRDEIKAMTCVDVLKYLLLKTLDEGKYGFLRKMRIKILLRKIKTSELADYWLQALYHVLK